MIQSTLIRIGSYIRSICFAHIPNMCISILFLCSLIPSIDLPSTYKCNTVVIVQERMGKEHKRGMNLGSLHLEINHQELKVFGIHSGKPICRKFPVIRTHRDTVFLKQDNNRLSANEIKLFFRGDTIVSTFNFFVQSEQRDITALILAERVYSVDFPIPQNCK